MIVGIYHAAVLRDQVQLVLDEWQRRHCPCAIALRPSFIKHNMIVTFSAEHKDKCDDADSMYRWVVRHCAPPVPYRDRHKARKGGQA